MADHRANQRPEADDLLRHEERRRSLGRDLLYAAAPLLLLVIIAQGFIWWPHFRKQSANRDHVASILTYFAAGIDYGEPLPVGVDHVILRSEVLLPRNEGFRLEQLSEHNLNDHQGRLLDVWGTPMRARRGSDWLEIRSAGADGRMDTADDEVGVRPVKPVTTSPPTPDGETNTPRSDDRGVSGER